MTSAKVSSVRAVDLGVTSVKDAARFFTEVWHLDVADEAAGVTYLRGTARNRYILSLRQAARTEIVRIVLGADTPETVEAINTSVSSLGSSDTERPRRLAWPGGGYGFRCKDPEGRNFAVVADVTDHAEGRPQADRPSKISHVNLNSSMYDAALAFARDALGFRLSDETGRMRFLQCNSDHHSMVLCNSGRATLNHIAFEMPDIDSLMRGIGRMRDHGYPIEWGPGRHGPGNNVFAYFVGPEQLPLEYTAEMLQCAAGDVAKPPAQWTWPAGRLDHWGLTAGPSPRFERTQELVVFSADGHQT